MATFEMFKSKMKLGRRILDIKSLADLDRDKLIGLQDIGMSDILLFIDDANTSEVTTIMH